MNVGQFLRRTRQDQEIADRIRAQNPALGQEGRDNRLHFHRADIAQRHDPHAVADPADTQFWNEVAPLHGPSRRNDAIHPTLAHQHRVTHPQHRLQGRQQLLPRQRAGGLHRHLALHLWIDCVIGLERVENHLDHIADVSPLEIQGHFTRRAASLSRRRGLGCELPVDKVTGSRRHQRISRRFRNRLVIRSSRRRGQRFSAQARRTADRRRVERGFWSRFIA